MTGDKAGSAGALAGGGTDDGQAEPSMEDILASIRRILTDDVEAPGAAGTRQEPAPPGPPPGRVGGPGSERGSHSVAPEPTVEAATPAVPPAPRLVRDRSRASNVFLLTPEMRIPSRRTPLEEAEATKRKVMSSDTAESGTDVLAQLAGAILDRRDIAVGSRDVTLESMVREMLRPLLREWLDRNLPYLIERLVKREIDLMVNRAERLED